MKRIIISAILFAALLLGGSGCMRNDTTQNGSAQDATAQNINDAALAYMEQKYGEKFEYVAPWGSSLSGTHELIVSCKSLPGQKIVVQIENYKQDDKLFRDNYLAVKYQKETETFLFECAEKVFGQAKILYTPSNDGQSDSIAASASFREYFADTRAAIMPTIVVKAGSFTSEEQAWQLAELIASSGTRYLISLSILSDNDYDSGSWQSLGEFLVQNYVCKGATISNSNSQIEIEWTEEG